MYKNLGKALRALVDSRQQQFTPSERNHVMAMVLGRAIATMMPIPTSAVTSVVGYFSTQFGTMAGNIITAVNEEILIDTELAYEMALVSYKLRYDLVYDSLTYVTLLEKLSTLPEAAIPMKLRETIGLITNPADRVLINTMMSTAIREAAPVTE